VQRRDLIIAGGSLLLLAIAVLRLATPSHERIRPLSIEGIELDLGRVDPGQTVTREKTWMPPDDVYLLGWNAWLGGPTAGDVDADLMLYDAQARTAIFRMAPASRAANPSALWNASALPPGTGYRALKGRPLTFRCRVTNVGATSIEPKGTTALVYFVPVEGN
jgi:hypothetical protein